MSQPAELVKHEKTESLNPKYQPSGVNRLIGITPAITLIRDTIIKLSNIDSTILITGETGTGKGLVARLIHDNSQRSHGQFVAFSCGIIPVTLFEGELFGHKKGAFTDACYERRGLFEEAEGGTLFLDDIQNAPLPIQAKLLQAIEDKTIRRLGESALKKVDVRIICATNEDLKILIKQGLFREDLYYRISVIPIHIPLLCERVTDIPILADFFLKDCAIRARRRILGFDNKAKKKMMLYSWPGNVREMQNVIERAVALSSGPRISTADVQLGGSITSRKKPFSKETIACLLNATKGNISLTARVLGVTRRTLYRYLKNYKATFNQ
jgi:DNA-binding NtrC family response regulator